MSDSVRLAQAQEALHNLVTGKMASVVVDQNGERVEFSKTNVGALQSYIATLTGAISGTPANRPIGFWF